MQPVLGREVEEAQQLLGIVDDLGDGLGPLGLVVAGEGLDGPLGMVAVGRVADLRQRLAGAGLHTGGQAAQHVGRLVDPVALVTRGGEDVTQRRPQPKRAVTDRQDRGAHAAPAQIPQQLGPRLGRLPLAIGHGDQLLAPVGAHADDHQAAQPRLLQPHPEVDPVRPHVHVVTVGEVTLAEGLVVGLPGGDQPGDDRRRQPRRGAEERLQGGREVAGRQAVQVQQRQHLGHLGALAAPRRQDHRPEPRPLAGHRIDAAVIHPRRADPDRPGHGQDLALAGVAIADHQPAATLVPLGGMRGQVGVDLGLQGGGEHPPGALAGQLVQVGVQLGTHRLVSNYTQHCGVTLLAGAPTPAPT